MGEGRFGRMVLDALFELIVQLIGAFVIILIAIVVFYAATDIDE